MGWRNLIVVGAVCAVAVAATVDALRGSGTVDQVSATGSVPEPAQAEGLEGPDVPAAGALPGSLVLAVEDDCRLRLMSFAKADLGDPGPSTGCELWASPKGRFAVVSTERSGGRARRSLALARLGPELEIVQDLGQSVGVPAWSPDGATFAWCSAGDGSIVHAVATGAEHRVPGCFPKYASDGALLTLPADPLDARLLRGGETFLDGAALRTGLDTDPETPVQVAAFDTSPDGQVAVSLLVLEPTGSEVVLELWRDGRLDAAFELPKLFGPGNARFGDMVRFSPDGRELAVGFAPGPGRVSFVDLRLQQVTVRSVDQNGFAWSPDGAWLAVSTAGRVEIYGEVRDTSIYTLPITASGLGWLPPAGGTPE